MHIKPEIHRLVSDFTDAHQLGKQFINVALNWFIPLAEAISTHHGGAKEPFFVGINGCQGSGKSTLTQFVHQYLEEVKGLTVASMSLDDFYLAKSERFALSIKVHPLLATRGVPGTHNTDKIQDVFSALIEQSGTTIPKFNKATDDPYPQSEWQASNAHTDIVLFEGWCWGVLPEHKEALSTPINTLEKNQDPLGVWRQYVNQQIQHHYLPLYKQMHFWIQLKAPSFDCVYRWRLQQEEKLINAISQTGNEALINASGIMQPQQIMTFIQHFQRLTTHALKSLPDTCDIVFALDQSRAIIGSKGLK